MATIDETTRLVTYILIDKETKDETQGVMLINFKNFEETLRARDILEKYHITFHMVKEGSISILPILSMEAVGLG